MPFCGAGAPAELSYRDLLDKPADKQAATSRVTRTPWLRECLPDSGNAEIQQPYVECHGAEGDAHPWVETLQPLAWRTGTSNTAIFLPFPPFR